MQVAMLQPRRLKNEPRGYRLEHRGAEHEKSAAGNANVHEHYGVQNEHRAQTL